MAESELLRACREGNVVEVQRLLPQVWNPADARDRIWKESLLHYSCRHGWLDVARSLVEQYHCDLESRDLYGDTPLHEACRVGHVDIVRYLVSEQECSTACQNKKGDTPLHVACRKGHLTMVKALTSGQDCIAACNSQNKDGDTPLLEACRKDHVDIVRYLVSEQGCSVVYQNEDGDTLLHVACRKGHLTMVKALTSGQDCIAACNSQNKRGSTPLHEACREGHVDIVRYLVSEQGCSIACQNKYGDTPLLMACRGVHLAVVEILLSGQDSSTACNKHSKSLIHYSCRHGWLDVARSLVEQYHCDLESRDLYGDTPLHEACRVGHVDTVRYLVSEQGCSTACQNKKGDTPLYVACREGHVDIVRYLVSEQGCSTTCQNKKGDTPLHVACREGHVDIVRYLVSEQGCSTACQNKKGDTPLYVACHEGHVDIVRYLVSEQGCSIAYWNTFGNTPLHEACRKGHLTMVKALTRGQDCKVACNHRNKDGNTPLHVACRKGHLTMVKALTRGQDCKVACNRRNKDGNTPLRVAFRMGHVDIVRYLVSEQGCTACQSKDGDTPLHEASQWGHADIVKYLVSEQGCSTAWQNKDGDTPLHKACRKGHLTMVKALTSGQDCKVACNRQNKDGDTPLHEAGRKGHVDVVKYLVSEQGCSIACQNKDGNTPLHMACRWNRTDVVKILLWTGRVDPWCKNDRNQTPVQLTNNYTISKLFAGLTKAKLVTANKVFIFGNPAAGKSTLVKAIENKGTFWFGAFRNVSGVELNTAGINTVTIQNSRLGTVTIYDLAGQFEYYSSHDALVENLMSSSAAIFMAVVKLSESEAEVIQALRYWISFVENCCIRVEATAHLMIVGSWADKVKEAGENIDQKWSNIRKACISSSSPLRFVGFTALDCRKLASSGLDKICDMIESSCTALREATEQKEIIYPHLLHAFISTKLSGEVACSVGELCTLITAEDDALLPTEPNLLSPLLSTLSDGGHLLYLPNKEDFEAGWVVINKQTVLSEINGTVFAPEYFKQHHDIATSTGVVPKSKIAGVFAEKYNIDMILSVLISFEFCQKINDDSTLSLIATSDPSREYAAAVTTSDDSSQSYYFFPALVRVEHPTDVWQSSGPRWYQCGWCLQCFKKGQYLTPRFLHVLLLRLAFSFALAPERSQQNEASPVLRRRCAIWKNGIQWLDQDGVETIVEVSEQNRLVLLMMSCPGGEEMACVQLRSSLISKILGTKEELCSGICTTELLIDPSNLSSYPLPSSSELTLYTIDQVVKAVREGKQFAVDITGRKIMKLVNALHFEPYLGLDRKVLEHLFCKYCAGGEVSESFLHDLAGNFCPEMEEQVPIATLLKVFKVPSSYIQSVYEQFPEERDSHVRRCFRVLVAWKDNFDTGGSTYQSLRTTLDKYSIFCGRNPVS